MEKVTEKILEAYRIYYPKDFVFNVKDLKGKYIPEKREFFEKVYGQELCDEIFGQATFLEKAETLLLKIRQENISKQEKNGHIISIIYHLTNACGTQVNSESEVYYKYGLLHINMPVEMYGTCKSPLNYPEFSKKVRYVTCEELRGAKNYLASKFAEDDLSKKAYLEYVFELVEISLKKIFEEIKKEIMG